MNKLLPSIPIVVLIASLLGCASVNQPDNGNPNTTRLDDFIFALNRAVISAQEKALFEEYIKYYEFDQSYFSILNASKIKLRAGVSLDQKTQMGGNLTVSVNPNLQFEGSEAEENQREGKLSITLEPMNGNTLKNLQKVIKIFDQKKYKIYNLFYFNPKIKFNSKMFTPKTKDAYYHCQEAMPYCVPIDGLSKKNGLKAWAYPKNIKIFKCLESQLAKATAQSNATSLGRGKNRLYSLSFLSLRVHKSCKDIYNAMKNHKELPSLK